MGQNAIYCVYDRQYRKMTEGTAHKLSIAFNITESYIRNRYSSLKTKMTADKFPVFVRKNTEFDNSEKLREIISKGHKTYYLHDGINNKLVCAGTGREVADWIGVTVGAITKKCKAKSNIVRPKNLSKCTNRFFRLTIKENTFEFYAPTLNVNEYLDKLDSNKANFIDIKPFPYIHKKDWFDIINLNLVNIYKQMTPTGLFMIVIKTFDEDIITEEYFHKKEEQEKRYKELKEFQSKRKYGKLHFGEYKCNISDIVTIYQRTNDTMFILFKDGTEKKIRTKTKEGINNIFSSIRGEFIR